MDVLILRAMTMKALLTFLFMLTFSLAFSQTAVPENKLDTADVIRIAKRRNAYWTETWYAQPSIQFDTTKAEWTIISYKTRHTNKGECKHTNGCTETTTVTLVINATNGRVKSKTKEKNLFHNYE